MFIALPQVTRAQARPPLPKNNYQLEVRTHYGFYLHHHLEFRRFNATFPSFELAFQRSTYGNQRWEALYAYPIIGFSFFYSGMGGFEEIGEVYAVYPFINFPLNRDVDNRINFRLGVGLGYLTNKFDIENNPKNFAIGSHLNAAASLFFDYRKTISPRFTFVAAAGLTHFSNGSTKTPNYGLNMLTAVAGINFYLTRPNPYLEAKFLPILRPFEYDNKKWFSVEIMQSVGTRDMSQQLGERYFVSNTSANIMLPFALKYKIGLGLEMTYDGSDKAMLDHKKSQGTEELIYENDFHLIKFGAGLAYELMMSKTSFIFHLGYHNLAGRKIKTIEDSDPIENKLITKGIVYQKLGIKHHFTDNVFGSIALTAHGGRADFIGFGIGYKWDVKYYLSRNYAKGKW